MRMCFNDVNNYSLLESDKLCFSQANVDYFQQPNIIDECDCPKECDDDYFLYSLLTS